MSNRTKKCCVYRDCDTDNIAHPERTLFQFPKNIERAAKWCELGAVDTQNDSRPQFMCDRHFSRIYMCFSARRKMLLNTAVPFAYGTVGEVDEHEQLDGEEQEVQSSSHHEEEGINIERLDEDIDYEGMETEIIYMAEEEEEFEDQPAEPPQQSSVPVVHSLKRPTATAPAAPIQKNKLMRVDKLPTLSTVVSSSSSAAAPPPSISIEDSLKPITPPKGTVLRKVKLKKRPNFVKPPIAYQTQTIIIKAAIESSEDDDPKPVEEPSVSSGAPAKKNLKVKVDPPEPAPEKPHLEITTQPEKPVPSEAASSTVDPKPVAATKEESQKETCGESSSSTTASTTTSSSADTKKDESIYEFIFKGEEYVQLPKAMWEGQRKDLQQQLNQCVEEKQRLERKVENYRKRMNELQKFLTDMSENEDE